MARCLALTSILSLIYAAGLCAQPQPVALMQSPQFAVPATNALSTADFNADGNADLLVTSATPPSLVAFLNNGQGQFQPVTSPLQAIAHRAVVGNFNADPYPDVAVCHEGSVEILLGNGDGTFTSVSSVMLPYPSDLSCRNMATADFNQDGNADLVVPANTVGVVVYLGDGTGHFTKKSNTPVPGVPGIVLTGAFHTGGPPDIVAAYGSPSYGPFFKMFLLAGNGDGTFQRPVPISPAALLTCTAGDYNHDGNLDLACALQFESNLHPGYDIFLGKGDGTFQSRQTYQSADFILNMQTTDLDGDGNPDLIFEFGSYCFVPCSPTSDDPVAALFGKGDGTFYQGTYLSAGIQALTAVAADFTSDGHADLAVLQKSSSVDPALSAITFLYGKGNRQFESPRTYYQGAGGTRHFNAADFNGDGNLDLVAFVDDYVNSVNGINFLPGQGDGRFGTSVFTPTTVGMFVGGPADFNGDGKLDLWAGDVNGNLDILLGDGGGGFQQVSSIAVAPTRLSVADTNNDGIPDLVVQFYQSGGSAVEVLLGNGDGTFQSPILLCETCRVGCKGDFNGDGIVDLLVFLQEEPVPQGIVYLGQGDGTFQPGPLLPPNYVGPATAADLNGDGILDLVISGPTLVLLGNGDGAFQPGPNLPNPAPPASVPFLVADFNGDGILDVAVVSNSQVTFLLGAPGLTFVPQARVVPFSNVYDDPSALVGDFNNDGKPDLAIFDQPVHIAYVLLNTTP